MPKPLAAALLPCLLALIAGCSAPPRPATPERVGLNEQPAGPERAADPRARDRVPLLIGGEPVTWAQITPLLAEAGGGQVVDELVLEEALRRALLARGLQVDDAAVEAERGRWLGLLEQEGFNAGTEAEIRRRRGLGPERFGRMLWRNAALRSLLEPGETEVSEREIDLASEVRAGPRYAASGVVLPGAQQAVRFAERMNAGAGGAAAAMWNGATEAGVRPWHAVISPLDPGWPEAVRRVLPSLAPGRASGAIGLDDGYAVVLVHARIPPSDQRPDRDALRQELEIRKTRVAMERLARQLIDDTPATILDRGLSWSR